MTDDEVRAAVQGAYVYIGYRCPTCGASTAAVPYFGTKTDLVAIRAAIAEALELAYSRHDQRHRHCRFRPNLADVFASPPIYPAPVQQ